MCFFWSCGGDARRTDGPTKKLPLYDRTGWLQAEDHAATRLRHDDYAGIARALDHDGYAVVAGVIKGKNALAQARASLWRSVADVKPPSAAAPVPQPGLWSGNASKIGGTLAEWRKLREMSTGFGMPWSLAHSELFWRVRSLPRLRRIFAEAVFGGTEDLIVSFDTGSVFPPTEIVEDAVGYDIIEGWLHADQSPLWRPGPQTVQSFVSLYDQNRSTGAFVVYPGSHMCHDLMCGASIGRSRMATPIGDDDPVPIPPPKVGENFVQIQPADAAVTAFLPECGASTVPRAGARLIAGVKAGDALLWDSRVAHMSSPPEPYQTRSEAPWEIDHEYEMKFKEYPPARAVVYVSMAPRRWADDEVLLRRQQAFRDGEPCTHWPYLVDSCVGEKNKPHPVRSLMALSPPATPQRLTDIAAPSRSQRNGEGEDSGGSSGGGGNGGTSNSGTSNSGTSNGEATLALIGFTDEQLALGRRLAEEAGEPPSAPRHDAGLPKPPFCNATHCHNGTRVVPHEGWGFADVGTNSAVLSIHAKPIIANGMPRKKYGKGSRKYGEARTD